MFLRNNGEIQFQIHAVIYAQSQQTLHFGCHVLFARRMHFAFVSKISLEFVSGKCERYREDFEWILNSMVRDCMGEIGQRCERKPYEFHAVGTFPRNATTRSSPFRFSREHEIELIRIVASFQPPLCCHSATLFAFSCLVKERRQTEGGRDRERERESL